MLAVKSVNVRDNFKEWCDKISMGETVVISRPRNQNIYMINETEYNELQKAKRNAEYLAMLDKSEEQLQKGDTITFTLEELREMEADDWKPTKKILEFEKELSKDVQALPKYDKNENVIAFALYNTEFIDMRQMYKLILDIGSECGLKDIKLVDQKRLDLN